MKHLIIEHPFSIIALSLIQYTSALVNVFVKNSALNLLQHETHNSRNKNGRQSRRAS